MNNKIYKLSFPTGVHFGKKNLEETEITFGADVLFSALALEALRMGEEVFQSFYESTEKGNLLFSDACPYVGKQLYIPKPFIHIEHEKSDISSKQKKTAKKLKYLPANKIKEFYQSSLDLEQEVKILSGLGKNAKKVSVAINGKEESEPYRIGIYYFNEECGLYVCVRYQEQKEIELFEKLLHALSYTGIGGKKSAGLGRFTFTAEKMPKYLSDRLEGDYEIYMAMSSCMAKEDELEDVMENACFQLKKRSGFSETIYGETRNIRKKDLFLFSSGSCFEKKFSGDIFDVSRNGMHPVYRYAKTMLIGVK